LFAALAVPATSLSAQPEHDRQRPDGLTKAAAAFSRGEYREVDRLLSDPGTPSDPPAITLRARALITLGEYSKAEELLEPLVRLHPASEAGLVLGLLHSMLGRHEDAEEALWAVVAATPTGVDAGELFLAARAARALGDFHTANDLFRRAAAVEPRNTEISTAWGELLFEKHNSAEAAASFRNALEIDPDWAPAHMGLARTLRDENPRAAVASAMQALAINPSLVEAHLFLAEVTLDESRFELAMAAIDRAMAVNPRSLEAHALKAAIAFLEGNETGFEAEIARALSFNPAYGEAYRLAGSHAARHYRFDEAAALARRAIETDPGNIRAYADLGMHLLRTGDEEAARVVLEHAFREDPFDTVTYNLLALLDTLDTFETVEEGPLVIRLHPDEAAVLREYVGPLAMHALETVADRYGHAPEGPILVEVFPVHDDFAVRNVGLPGMAGALGACFGRVVTLNSPRARPPGTFNWGATLWHEMAHVVTLQMSNQRVPRWLTEGISVLEEKRARAEWGRNMEIPFARLLEQGATLRLHDLDAAFADPQQVTLAYYQSSLLVEYLSDTYGNEAIGKLLRAYGEGLDAEAALQRAAGIGLNRLEADFDRVVGRQFAPLMAALQSPSGVALEDQTLDQLMLLSARHSGSYPVLVALGQALARAGRYEEAMETLQRAAVLVPSATGDGSPLALMAGLAIAQGDAARAADVLEAMVARDGEDIESARLLVSLVDAAEEPGRAAAAYGRVVAIDPFDVPAHQGLGRLALARGEAAEAAREFRAALAAGPADFTAAHTDLGEAYLLAGDRANARRQALAALEIAPTFERAQELLLTVVEVRR
jgi:cellulose synthase operon protein C